MKAVFRRPERSLSERVGDIEEVLIRVPGCPSGESTYRRRSKLVGCCLYMRPGGSVCSAAEGSLFGQSVRRISRRIGGFLAEVEEKHIQPLAEGEENEGRLYGLVWRLGES